MSWIFHVCEGANMKATSLIFDTIYQKFRKAFLAKKKKNNTTTVRDNSNCRNNVAIPHCSHAVWCVVRRGHTSLFLTVHGLAKRRLNFRQPVEVEHHAQWMWLTSGASACAHAQGSTRWSCDKNFCPCRGPHALEKAAPQTHTLRPCASTVYQPRHAHKKGCWGQGATGIHV